MHSTAVQRPQRKGTKGRRRDKPRRLASKNGSGAGQGRTIVIGMLLPGVVLLHELSASPLSWLFVVV